MQSLRPLDGRPSIAHLDLEPFGRFAVGLPVDRAEEHFNWLVGPALVRMPDNICQRFIDCASDRAAIWRGKSERFRQSFHGTAHRTQQTGVAGQLQLQQQAAARVPVALPGFASPHWMKEFHVKLNFVLGFGSSAKRTSARLDHLSAKLQKLHRDILPRPKSCSLLATLFERGRIAHAIPKTRGGPLPAATENRCGTAGPQAWAEFCLAYCKRLGLLLAMPVIKIGCSARADRFKESSAPRLGHFLRK